MNFLRCLRITSNDAVKSLLNCWKLIVNFIQSYDHPTLEYLTNLKIFGELLLNTFEWKVLTPYIHIILDHSVLLITKWGNLSKYSQQGLEAANKLQKKIAQRCGDHTKSWSVKYQFYHFYRLIEGSNYN